MHSYSFVGINYEGGKIIEHIIKSPACLAYANIQIAMDAPFHNQVAIEEIRSNGRSETQFDGYDENNMINNLTSIFKYIQENYHGKILIQIARGKSAMETERDILDPILKSLNITDYTIKHGYHSTCYPDLERLGQPFVFVNYGMFARLTGVDKILPGMICNPIATIDILAKNINSFAFSVKRNYDDDKNILKLLNVTPIMLYGIADNMPFVTPVEYSPEIISTLF